MKIWGRIKVKMERFCRIYTKAHVIAFMKKLVSECSRGVPEIIYIRKSRPSLFKKEPKRQKIKLIGEAQSTCFDIQSRVAQQ